MTTIINITFPHRLRATRDTITMLPNHPHSRHNNDIQLLLILSKTGPCVYQSLQ
jgi:hypothetical protein